MKMKYLVMAILPLLITSVYAADLVYKVNLDIFRDDSVDLNSVSVIYGITSHFPVSDNEYQVKVFSTL